jgi:transcriptional regulator with XRE-family HTH domain
MVGMSEDSVRDYVRLAVALRSARSALGISQVEFADAISISKSSLARVETGEAVLPSDAMMRAIRFFKDNGIILDCFSGSGVTVDISEEGVDRAIERLADISRARSDRKKTTPRQMVRERVIPNPATKMQTSKKED